MAVEIITKEDLQEFRIQLLEDVKGLLQQVQLKQPMQQTTKEWLKSSEVRDLLHISPNTLQNLRIQGTIGYTKIGGIFFYRYEDLMHMLESKAINPAG
jgi:hypothetical protein